jgi:hypothetical protein
MNQGTEGNRDIARRSKKGLRKIQEELDHVLVELQNNRSETGSDVRCVPEGGVTEVGEDDQKIGVGIEE